MNTCRTCHRQVVWGLTATGKRMPLDAAPSMDGNVLLAFGRGDHGEDLADVLTGKRLDDARSALVALRTPHFATCPDALRWRRK